MTQIYRETYCNNLDEFLKLGKSLGKLMPSRKSGKILDLLTPLKEEQTKKDSLSKRYGLNEFPAHTDCAYYYNPPKYILLRFIGSGENITPTVLLKINKRVLEKTETDFLNRAIWFVKGINGNFYTKVLQNGILRYDPEVMTLVSNRENLMGEIIQKAKTYEIKWEQNKVAIINNWNCLHYRPKVKIEETETRILQRINIV